MKKRSLILCAALIASMMLAACGSSGKAPETTAAPAAETTAAAAESVAAETTAAAAETTAAAAETAAPEATAAETEAAADGELPALSGGFESPILITSAGQSADANIVQTLCTKAGIVTELNVVATGEDLANVKTLVISVGGSSKGLGAAGIDADQEIERVSALIAAAKDAGVKIVSMHVGGGARRGDLSDKFIAAPFEAADAAVVVSSGDADNMIRDILTANGTPAAYVDDQISCVDCLTTLFK